MAASDRPSLAPYLQVAPMMLVFLVFLVVPLVFIVMVSFWTYENYQIQPAFEIQNYLDVFDRCIVRLPTLCTTFRTYLSTLGFCAMVWALTLVYAVARPARRAWIELLWLATAAIGLLPVLNALTTDRGLPASLRQGDGVYVALELTLLALAALHAMLAIRTARHRPRVRVPKSRRDVAGEPGEGVAA